MQRAACSAAKSNSSTMMTRAIPRLCPGIYAKLLDIDKIDLVIASYGTNMTLPVMPVGGPQKTWS